MISLWGRKEVTMATSTLKIDELQQHFANWDKFTLGHINEFYRARNILLPETTFRWRIYRLVKMGVLKRIGRGIFTLGDTVTYIPAITEYTGNIYNIVHRQYPYTEASIWHTSSLNEFMLHQPGRFMHILEVEKDAAESVFYFLKDEDYDVFLNPNEEIFQNYVSTKREAIVIKNLITESPLQNIYNVQTPTIEKILVDIFSDQIIFAPYQGNEMNYIFENAFRKYSVNITTLLRYAQRRGKKEELFRFLRALDLVINP